MYFTLGTSILSALGYKYECKKEFIDNELIPALKPISETLTAINYETIDISVNEVSSYDFREEAIKPLEMLLNKIMDNCNANKNCNFYFTLDDIIPVMVTDEKLEANISKEYLDNPGLMESLQRVINNFVKAINDNKEIPTQKNIIVIFVNVITKGEPITFIKYNPFTDDVDYWYNDDGYYDDIDEDDYE